MLLSQKSELGNDLVRSFSRRGEPSLQVGVLLFDDGQPLMREQVGGTVRGFEGLEPAFGGECAFAEPGQLFAKAVDELYELVK